MSYLNFVYVGRSPSGKTSQYRVSGSNDVYLGLISWYGAWRKYVFYPGDGLFDPSCLRELADFCETETTKHKAEKAQ